jgi:AraC family transcriptional regulator of adaptative response / DNA-3-methyladenine glycosylase II
MDVAQCYRALESRDARFDGLFFVGVATTGIYCRPVCTARTPRRDRCAFFANAAAAEHAGFRACFRCRPELAPGRAPVDSVPRLVAAATAKIEEGFLHEGSVDELAAELGVASRHLRRAVHAVLGVSPAELARTRRLALAKQLLHDTDLGLAEVAFAAGFGSVRRFNAAFRAAFDAPPSRIRRARVGEGAAGVQLRLGYRRPFDWALLLGFLASRAVPGIEDIGDGVYARNVRIGALAGRITVTDDAAAACLRVELPSALAGAAMPIAAKLRALFDLDARPDQIGEALARDPALAPLVRARPGLRVPGAFDPFEVAVRAVLGQQVSVRAASTLTARLVERFGDGAFPSPAVLGDAAVAAIGMPAARAAAVSALARAVASGAVKLGRGADPERAVEALEALPGIGPWTAHYVAMRALGWPDAFPANDLVVKRVLPDAKSRSDAWRPWRAYAVLHLWTKDSQS